MVRGKAFFLLAALIFLVSACAPAPPTPGKPEKPRPERPVPERPSPPPPPEKEAAREEPPKPEARLPRAEEEEPPPSPGESPEALYAKVLSAMVSEGPARAAKALKGLLSSYPREALSYRARAELSLYEGRQGEAETLFARAAELEPGSFESRLGLAKAKFFLGKTEEARELLEALSEDKPGEPEVKLYLGLVEGKGELAPSFYTIPETPFISRGDAAALLDRFLLDLKSPRPEPFPVIMTDIRGHWALAHIQSAVQHRVLDAFPDHTFRPRAMFERGRMARALERYFSHLGMEDRAPESILPIPDVSPRNVLYPSVVFALSFGLMERLPDGSFGLRGGLSGKEALLVMERARFLAKLFEEEVSGRPVA